MMVSSNSRKVRELAFRQELLLEAAEKVFVERGFAGASVENIARRGGVALATLYKSLPSKEAIFIRVMERRQQDFLRALREGSQSGAPLARLEAVVRITVGYFVEHGDIFRMYLAATQGFPWHIRSGLGEEFFANYAGFIDYVESLCREALPRSRRAAARTVAVSFLGATNTFLTDRFAGPRRKRAAGDDPAAELWDVVRALVSPP